MSVYTKELLSGSSYGKAITISATSSTGTTIHATGTSSSVIDEVWLYALNTSSSPVTLTIQYGGTDAVQNAIPIIIPADLGPVLVIPGFILTGTGSASSTVYAYADTANVLTVMGYVNRIS